MFPATYPVRGLRIGPGGEGRGPVRYEGLARGERCWYFAPASFLPGDHIGRNHREKRTRHLALPEAERPVLGACPRRQGRVLC